MRLSTVNSSMAPRTWMVTIGCSRAMPETCARNNGAPQCHAARFGKTHEQAPRLRNHRRRPVSDGRHDWLCYSRQGGPREACISVRRRVDRTHGTYCNRVWSLSAAGPQLGTVACARLDRVPPDVQLLRFTAVLRFTREGSGS